MRLGKLRVSRVTAEHGDRFAEKWLRECLHGTDLYEAFGASGVMPWPATAAGRGRYQDIEDATIAMLVRLLKPVVSEAFVKAARYVLSYEGAWRREAYLAATRKHKGVKPGIVKTVHQVTLHHGERFAEECAKLTNDHTTPCDVFAETEIFEWPEDDPVLQARYHELKREIFAGAMSAAGHALAEAFVAVANEVIERERRRR